MTAFRWLVAVFGAACAAIGAGHVALGPRAIPGGVVTTATMDSEDRFYGTLFLFFGLALIWASRDVGRRRRLIAVLFGVFFAAGLSRLVSLAVVGPPSPLFQFLTGVELLLPPIVWWWQRRLSAPV